MRKEVDKFDDRLAIYIYLSAISADRTIYDVGKTCNLPFDGCIVIVGDVNDHIGEQVNATGAMRKGA